MVSISIENFERDCSLLAKELFTSVVREAASSQRGFENGQWKFRNPGACRSANSEPGAKSAGATPLCSRSPFESLLIYNADRAPPTARATRAPCHYHFWRRRRNSPAVATASDVRRTCRHSMCHPATFIAPDCRSHRKILSSYNCFMQKTNYEIAMQTINSISPAISLDHTNSWLYWNVRQS